MALGRLGENPEKIEIRIGIPLRTTLPDSFSGIPKRNPNHLAPNHQLTISWFFESNHSKCWKNYQINGVWFITNKTKGVFYKELLNGDDHPHKTANSKNTWLFDDFFCTSLKTSRKKRRAVQSALILVLLLMEEILHHQGLWLFQYL